MKKVMIVDDEIGIRENIRKLALIGKRKVFTIAGMHLTASLRYL